ncbi:MAG: hypothetical protein WA461_12795 [Nitrososphaeraceae archaeon]
MGLGKNVKEKVYNKIMRVKIEDKKEYLVMIFSIRDKTNHSISNSAIVLMLAPILEGCSLVIP